jgi:hypothetical protein
VMLQYPNWFLPLCCIQIVLDMLAAQCDHHHSRPCCTVCRQSQLGRCCAHCNWSTLHTSSQDQMSIVLAITCTISWTACGRLLYHMLRVTPTTSAACHGWLMLGYCIYWTSVMWPIREWFTCLLQCVSNKSSAHFEILKAGVHTFSKNTGVVSELWVPEGWHAANCILQTHTYWVLP